MFEAIYKTMKADLKNGSEDFRILFSATYIGNGNIAGYGVRNHFISNERSILWSTEQSGDG